jgi:hypothetical protein
VIKQFEKLLAKIPEGTHAHPRIVHTIVEEGSWNDDEEIQRLWGGLLASSCTKTGDDDSNLIFAKLLKNLTRMQARILKYACENSGKRTLAGLIFPHHLIIPFQTLCQVAEEKNLDRFDREMDDLRMIGLLNLRGGITATPGQNAADDSEVDVTPTPLALHMYVRCAGSRLSPIDFFKVQPETPAS